MSTPPYHLFKVLGDDFMFDTVGCRFYRINALTADFLLLCLGDSVAGAEKALSVADKYDADEVKAAAKEISMLGRNGLFGTPGNYIDLRQVREELGQMNLAGGIDNVELMLAENCNLACRYCYCAVSRDCPSRGLMTENIARRAIDFLMEQNTEALSITMFGGEPLLNRPVIDFIMGYSQRQAKLHARKLNYILTTNATLLDAGMIDYITDFNFGLMVSLDGPKELHDRQCPAREGGGSFDRAMDNIKQLMQRRTVGVRATMTHPAPRLKELIDFFSESGFSVMTIAEAANRAEAPSEVDFTRQDMKELNIQQEELIPWVLEFLKNGETPPYFPEERWLSAIERGNIHREMRIFNCGAGRSKAAVDADGNLYPCTKYCGMKNWRIGTLDDGIDQEKIKRLWLSFLKCIRSKCGTCWAYTVCGGPCIWDCSRNDGTFCFNDIHCASRKRGMERAAYLYCQLQEYVEQREAAGFRYGPEECTG